jgi:hypothetical protein
VTRRFDRPHRCRREARWDEIAGPNGKAKVVARGMVIGRDAQIIEGIPGQWSTTETGTAPGLLS